jgi:hypothetical protein
VSINNENPALTITNLERNILEGNVISTGTYEYTGMTQGVGQTINISPLKGWVVLNTYDYATSPDVINVIYSGGTNIPLTYLTTADTTFILISSASTVIQQTTFPTPQERRQNIFIGRISHPKKSTIESIIQTVDFDVSPMSALRDLWTPIKLINQGVLISANGANLNINLSAGSLWGNGVGWTTNQLNPDNISIASQSPATFQYRTQLGIVTGTTVPTGNTTTISPGFYDLNGVITAVGGGSASSTNQRVYLFPTGSIRIQLGQQVYSTLAAAVTGSQTEQFVEYSDNRDNGILIGIISVNKTATQLNNSAQAVFNFVSKFGEVLGGTGGLSTTTLQQAYDNSSNPEIITNLTQDGVQFRGGTGNDADKNIIIENNAGNATAWLNADGSSHFTTITATTKIITTNFQMTSGATNGYVLTSDTFGNARWAVSTGGSGSTGTDYYVTGGTYNNTTGILTLNRQNGSLSIPGFTTSLSGYALNYYGSFSNTGNIPVTAANTSTVWTYNQTELSNGITIVDNSKIKVFNKGVYEIGYSPQIEKTQGTDALVTIWAEVNGNPVTRSSSTLGLVSNSTYQLPFVSLIFELEANDYVQFYFSSNSQYVQLTALSGLTTPTRPDSPSLIVIAKQIGASVPSSYVFTGNTSANCISDIYVSNLHGCSPITIHDSIQSVGSSATGITSFAFGNTTVAAGDYSHAEGNLSIASGIASHAEGNLAQAKGEYSHAEGDNTQAIGDYSHAEGQEAISSGSYSHAEGYATLASGSRSHAEGRGSKTAGNYSHAEGDGSHAVGERSHAEGLTTSSLGYGSHSEGLSTATGIYAYTLDSVLAGVLTLNTSYGDVTTEFSNTVILLDGVTLSYLNISSVNWNGTNTIITLQDALINSGTLVGVPSNVLPTGADQIISNSHSHTEGEVTKALGIGSHAEGLNTLSMGDYSHSQGINTIALGYGSFASGSGSTVSGIASFIHSTNSTVTGDRSVVLGGQGISGTSSDFVYVSSLNINSTPANNDALTQILVRDSSSGEVKYRDSSTLGGGSSYSIVKPLNNYISSATTGEQIILCNTSGGTFNVTLPNNGNAKVTIKKIGGAPNLIVNTSGGQTIDGTSTATVTVVNASITFITDGSNWFII